MRLRWPEMGDAPLWGAAVLLWLLELEPDFRLQDICRRLLVKANLAGHSGECLWHEGALRPLLTPPRLMSAMVVKMVVIDLGSPLVVGRLWHQCCCKGVHAWKFEWLRRKLSACGLLQEARCQTASFRAWPTCESPRVSWRRRSVVYLEDIIFTVTGLS